MTTTSFLACLTHFSARHSAPAEISYILNSDAITLELIDMSGNLLVWFAIRTLTRHRTGGSSYFIPPDNSFRRLIQYVEDLNRLVQSMKIQAVRDCLSHQFASLKANSKTGSSGPPSSVLNQLCNCSTTGCEMMFISKVIVTPATPFSAQRRNKKLPLDSLTGGNPSNGISATANSKSDPLPSSNIKRQEA